jgi:hypothetical protein
MAPTMIAPYRRGAFQELVWGMILVFAGLAQSVMSRSALAIFFIGIAIGFIAERRRERAYDPAIVLAPPPDSVRESAIRGWIRTLGDLRLIVVLAIVGIWVPAFAGIAGGIALGLNVETLLVVRRVARIENAYAYRLFYEVPPRWFDGSRRTEPRYFRVPARVDLSRPPAAER